MTQKSEICDHFLGKNKIFEIFASILTRFFFSKFKIFKIFFIQPPKFIPYTNFKHQKWKLQGGFIIVPLPYWTGRASKQAASWFLPPLGLFRVKLEYWAKNFQNQLTDLPAYIVYNLAKNYVWNFGLSQNLGLSVATLTTWVLISLSL